MKLARRGFHTAFLGGYLYVIGGNDKVGNEVFDMAQFYDRQVCTEPNRNRGYFILSTVSSNFKLESSSAYQLYLPLYSPALNHIKTE